jgi:hypothetical protein
MVEHKEDRATLAKWGNDLRQTYRTIAQTVGIGDLDIHLLMNHAVAGVNAGYITRSKLLSDHLREQQESISRKMMDAVRGAAKVIEERPANWPLAPARAVLKTVLQGADFVGKTKCASREMSGRRASDGAAGHSPILRGV